MKKEIAEQWVKALRSGEYAQARGQLRRKLSEGTDSFCCLGVLCDLHMKATNDGTWCGELCEVYASDTDADFEAPGADVVEWAGLSQANPKVVCYDSRGVVEDALTIAELNDSYGWSFGQLANLIERQWEDM